MSKRSPIQFLITHKETILQAYEQNDRKSGKTWQSLQETLPELSKTMSLNTFKQYISLFIAVIHELDKVIHERDQVRQKLYKTEYRKAELEAQVKDLEKRLHKVIQNNDVPVPIIRESDNSPKRIAGWSIQKAKDGYYRCYRKIENKLHCVYIGKTFDAKKAQSRVVEKEKRLGLYKS
jgi:BMFP domain-containing protein YqiC